MEERDKRSNGRSEADSGASKKQKLASGSSQAMNGGSLASSGNTEARYASEGPGDHNLAVARTQRPTEDPKPGSVPPLSLLAPLRGSFHPDWNAFTVWWQWADAWLMCRLFFARVCSPPRRVIV